MPESRTISGDILIILRKAYISDWKEAPSHRLSCLEWWEGFSMISASYLLSCGVAMKRDPKIRFVDNHWKKAMRVD